MIDRRTFLKLSAGALVLTAAGALTGCGTTMDLNHPQQEVDGVMFLCDVLSDTDFSGGAPTKIQYRPYFAIWNRSEENVSLPRKDITGIFTKNGAAPENTFGLETENSIPSSRQNGTYELRIKYKGKTIVFFYDGEHMTSRVE